MGQGVLVGVDVDGQVDQWFDPLVRWVHAPRPSLEHGESLHHQQVGPTDPLELTGNDVIPVMRVDGHAHLGPSRADGLEGRHQRGLVIGLGESFAAEEAALLEHPVGKQEAIGGEQIDRGPARTAAQQPGQDAGRGGLARRHAAGDPDHGGGPMEMGTVIRVGIPAERNTTFVHPLLDPSRQGKVDLAHLVGIDRSPAGRLAGPGGVIEQPRCLGSGSSGPALPAPLLPAEDLVTPGPRSARARLTRRQPSTTASGRRQRPLG